MFEKETSSLRVHNTFLELERTQSKFYPTVPSTTPAAFAPRHVFPSTMCTITEFDRLAGSPLFKGLQISLSSDVSVECSPRSSEVRNSSGTRTPSSVQPTPSCAATSTPQVGEGTQMIRLADFIATPSEAERQNAMCFGTAMSGELLSDERQPYYDFYGDGNGNEFSNYEENLSASLQWGSDFNAYDLTPPSIKFSPETYPSPVTIPVDPSMCMSPPLTPPAVGLIPPTGIAPPPGLGLTPRSAGLAPPPAPAPVAPPPAPAPQVLAADTRTLLKAVLDSKNPYAIKVIIDHARRAGLTPEELREMLAEFRK